jgi:hypothetical protein
VRTEVRLTITLLGGRSIRFGPATPLKALKGTSMATLYDYEEIKILNDGDEVHSATQDGWKLIEFRDVCGMSLFIMGKTGESVTAELREELATHRNELTVAEQDCKIAQLERKSAVVERDGFKEAAYKHKTQTERCKEEIARLRCIEDHLGRARAFMGDKDWQKHVVETDPRRADYVPVSKRL